MYLLFVLSLVSCVFGFDESGLGQCGYPYKASFTYRVDKVYPNPSPLKFGADAYTIFVNNLHLTSTQIEIFRTASLNWFNKRFGIPNNITVYDNTTKVTTIPGWGIVVPVIFYPAYDLISSKPVVLGIGCPRLTVVEFTFIAAPEAVNVKPFGGSYGALYPELIQRGDALSFGYYLVSILNPITKERNYVRKIYLKSKYVTRYLNPIDYIIQSYIQESYLLDFQFGQGLSKLQIRLNQTSEQLFADVTTVFIFSPILNPDNYSPPSVTEYNYASDDTFADFVDDYSTIPYFGVVDVEDDYAIVDKISYDPY